MTTETLATENAGRRAGRIGGIDLSLPVLAATAAFLALLIGLPMGWLAYYAVTDRAGAPTLVNFTTLASDPAFTEPLVTTLILCVSVAVAAAAVASPIAWLVARTDLPARRTIRVLMTASFVTPPFLGAIAWEILAAPNSGILNRWWRDLSGSADPLFDIYTLPGLAFVISCYTAPYVFVLVANALDRIPADLEDAAGILGAGRWRTAVTVTVPLVTPAILAGALIAFLQAMTLFGSPAILALPAGFHTVTTKIFSFFQYPPRPQLAAAAALPLLAVTVLLLTAQARLLGRRGYTVVGGKSGEPRRLALGRLKVPALALVLGVLSLPLMLPYAALLKAAVSSFPGAPFVIENLTWKHVNFVFVEFSQTRKAFWNTLVLALGTATLGTVLALVIAYLTARRAIAGSRILEFLATAPVAIPGIVLGVGLFLSYTRPPLALYGTLWILLLAFLTIELPIAFQQLRSSFRAVHPELEEASRILGAGRLKTLARITAPLLKSGVVAAWCFIFIGVVRELSAAIMLFTANTKVLSVVIYDLNESGDLGAIAVLGTVMLLITFAVVGFANWISGVGSGVRLRGG
ncbi:MAG: iron ABC transporter permease [Alphaproteobacteria bacterium]|nr:iron ABC transporter permease [Alphaproteobacteria bacterium]